MLGKLIKHEFKATARRIMPVLLILLAMTCIAAYVLPAIENSEFKIVRFFYGMGITLLILSFIAVGIVSILLLIERFRKHILGNEGYSMMTLPVTVHEILWSKLIVFFVWSVAVGVIDTLAILLVSRVQPYQIDRAIADVVEFLGSDISIIHYTFYFLELCLLIFVSFAGTCLGVFAALMIGHQSPKAKMFVSVLVYIGFNMLVSFLAVIGILLLEEIPGAVWDSFSEVIVATKMHLGSILAILISAIPAAVFYLITALGMKKHLNLE